MLKGVDMNRTTGIAASFLGVYAGLLAAEHGIFEILQGSQPTGGMLINAIGPPCQAGVPDSLCLAAVPGSLLALDSHHPGLLVPWRLDTGRFIKPGHARPGPAAVLHSRPGSALADRFLRYSSRYTGF